MYRLERRVAADTDDCVRNTVASDLFDLTAVALAAGYQNAVLPNLGAGMRFLSIAIPPGSTIHAAHLRLVASNTRANADVNSRIRCQDADNPLTFSDLADFDARTWTTAAVAWNDIPAWTAGEEYVSPNFAACVQEVINRPGWESGRPLVVLWDDFDENSTAAAFTFRQAHSHVGDPALAPVLILSYTPPASPHQLFDRFGRPRGAAAYGGEVYCNSNVAVDDNPRRFSVTQLKLNDVIIQVHDNPQAFGNFDIQDYEVHPGEAIGFTKVELSSLYFRNLNAGDNGTVTILGVEN